MSPPPKLPIGDPARRDTHVVTKPAPVPAAAYKPPAAEPAPIALKPDSMRVVPPLFTNMARVARIKALYVHGQIEAP